MKLVKAILGALSMFVTLGFIFWLPIRHGAIGFILSLTLLFAITVIAFYYMED